MTAETLLLYDDDCGFCSASVRFVRRHDRRKAFRFAPLASDGGKRMLAEYGVDPAVDSIVVIDDGRAAVRSAAVLAVVRRLGGAWHLLRIGGLVPRRIADAAYDAVARRRGEISRRIGLKCGITDNG